MADQVCVCGHDANCHIDMMGDRCTADCQCRHFRPALPWPDSEGNWWCQLYDGGYLRAPIVSRLIDGIIQVHLMNRLWSKNDLIGIMKDARFVKLLEQNPFERIDR